MSLALARRGPGLDSRVRASWSSDWPSRLHQSELQRGGQPRRWARRDWAQIETGDEPRFTEPVAGLFARHRQRPAFCVL